MKRHLFTLSFIILLTACHTGERHYVDFTDIPSTTQGMFRVTRQQTTDMQALTQDPNQLALWGLQQHNDTNSHIRGPQRASSTTINNVVQQLLDFSKMTTAIQLSGLYQSIDLDGNPITLSGKVILPAKGPIKRYILVSHYTIASNAEAPSNTFSLE